MKGFGVRLAFEAVADKRLAVFGVGHDLANLVEDLDRLPPDAGRGVKVVVLGGGIAGLIAAYELGKAGFQATLLEARERPGGRIWTVRGGSAVEHTGEARQTAGYAAGNYFNAGAARIPSIHKTILSYCKDLGVALEVEINSSRSTLLVNDRAFGGKPVEHREYAARLGRGGTRGGACSARGTRC